MTTSKKKPVKKSTAKKAPAKKAPAKKAAPKKAAAKKVESPVQEFFKQAEQELNELIDSVPAQVTIDTAKGKSWLRRFFKGLTK